MPVRGIDIGTVIYLKKWFFSQKIKKAIQPGDGWMAPCHNFDIF